MYQEELIHHYRFPQNKGELSQPDFSSDEHNPSCGDSVSMQGHIKNGLLTALAFNGKGCVISQATASLLTVLSKDKPIDEVLSYDTHTIKNIIKIEIGPMRLKCALLPLQALQQGIKKYNQILT